MCKRAFMIVSGIILLSIIHSMTFAQSPQISNGLSWLYSAQTATGNWPQVVTTDYYSTASALDAIYSIDPSNLSYGPAFQWMSTQFVSPTDYLSRQIVVLKRAGQDTSGYLASLLLYRNSDGGFGGADDCPNSYILDSALALHALKAANYADTTLIGQSLGYLTANQNTDGGWSLSSNDTSNTYLTSVVLRTVAAYNSVFINQNSINQASAFLLARQNTDGGFGDSPSTVYSTALSLISLIESGQGTTQTILNGINYLVSTQAANGSWNDDPYSTALALQALAEARPNLAVSSSGITLSNSMPQSGATTTISAAISNTGYDNASNVIVRFYLGDPAVGGTQIDADQIISSLTPNSSTPISITASFTGTGGKTIFVVIDPDNLISETSKADNKASTRVWIATGPDLAVYSEDLIPSTYVPTTGTPFTLNYTVRNLGETAADSFDVALYDGQPSGTPLQTAHISGLNGTEVRTGTLGVTLTTNGNHTLYLVADSGNQITEISKTNNTGTVTVNVGGTLTQADLAITPSDITLTPARPHAGDMVTISASVRNIGAEAAINFTVEIFDGQPESGGTLLSSQVLSLVAGGSQAVSTNWQIPAGIHDLVVVLDRTNQIAETNESNNRAVARLMTDMVDLSISATDLVFTPGHPVNGDSVVLSITAHNTGIKATGPFNLALYDGDPAAGGTLLQTFPISNITGDGSSAVSHVFTAIPWTYRFYAVADSENAVIEMYEDNNTAIRSLKIKAPGEVLGPDLVPTKIDLTDTATDPQTLAISGNAHVTFQNKGDDTITTSFNVLIFEDMDNDGRYTAGLDNLLGTSTMATGPTASIPAIWPEGAGLVSVPLSGTVKFLHSALYAFVDSGDAILEQDENNNLIRFGAECEYRPDTAIQPVLKWRWRNGQSPSTLDNVNTPPVVAPLKDTNGDGIVDGNDDPYVLFMTPTACGADCTRGKLHAVNGRTGVEEFSFSDPAHYMVPTAYIAVGDINNDGLPEICFPGGSISGGAVICLKNDGTLFWDNYDQVAAWSNPITQSAYVSVKAVLSMADVDADGNPEIIVGNVVFNGDGSVKWGYRDSAHTSGGNSNGLFGATEVADIDLDGKQEIIAGNTTYNFNGTVKWTNSSLLDGITAIGNLNNDQYPEIVYLSEQNQGTRGSRVLLLDHLGNIVWGPVYIKDFEPNASGGGNGSPPTIADFDGDGENEIGIKGNEKFLVLNKNDGSLKVSYATLPGNGQACTATVFDLDGDGRPEVIINTRLYFRIFDGKSGTLLYQAGFGGYYSFYQNAIVADVDGDGHAEIVVVGGDLLKDPSASQSGVNVYGFAPGSTPWVGARKIWNQPGYHVTNVNDDGSIPQHEAPSWLLNNTYHTQAAIGRNPNPYLTPNLTASYLRVEQAGASLNLAVRVGNGGAIASTPSVTVTFYDGNPASGGIVIGTASTTRALNSGKYQDVIYSWTGGSLGLHHIYAVVDAANSISECRKDDNQTSADFTIQVEYADLTIGLEDITLPAGPYTAGIPVTITANVKNIGTLSASNIAVRLYYGNPSAGGIQVGNDQVIPSINAGSSVPLVFTYDTTGKSGTNVLYIVVDPANVIVESSKTNNTAAIILTVQPPTLPDLMVTTSDMHVTPTTMHEGDTATITATVHNLGVSVGNIPVRVSVRSGEFGVGSEVYSETKTIFPVLGLGQSATVTATFDTTGLAGQQSIVVTIDPGNSITESRKDNNSSYQSFFVQSAGLNASVTLDKAAYQADDLVTASITAADTTGVSRSLTLGLYVQDSAGNRIANISTADPVAINPNSLATLGRTWNTGTTLSGQYTIIAELSESGRIISRKSAGFTILPDTRINAAVTTDKISYNPHDTAALTAVATSQSRNFIFNTLTAVLTIGTNLQTSPSGTIFTDTKTVNTLMPGATFTFKDYWNTGIVASGTYPVTLTIRDSTNAIIASSSQNLVISNIIKPTAVLRGQISVGDQELLSGDTTTVSYTVTNVGNIDIQNVSLSVLTVNVSDQTVYNTFTYPTTLAMGGTASNTLPITTTDYTAKDYLVVLRANIAGTEETLAGTYFRIEGAPSSPSLASPANGSDVLPFTPTLAVNNASDPNNDKLTYQFELYSDSGLTNLISSSGLLPEGQGSGQGATAWTVPIALIENQTYFWRAQAYDNWLYGPWMPPASFRVNTVDDPPTAPSIAAPLDGTSVATFTPTLTINNAADPDSPNLTYNFVVALDPVLTQITATTTGVMSGQGSTSWQVPITLVENTWYYWRAQADDWLTTGPWSTTSSFFVNTANNPPTTPVIINPANNSTIAALATDITVSNSTDPDSPVITYFFELDTVTTLDSPNIMRSGGTAQGQYSTIWHATGLQEDTQYYVRAKASDGQADSPWSGTVGFFANAVNEPPTTPTLANPSNGGAVTVFTPTLSVLNSTDPDRDVLTYDFEVYSDPALSTFVTGTTGIVQAAQITSWAVSMLLTENQAYYWRVRAFDGSLYSSWMPTASFMVNTADDSPSAPMLSSPSDGSSVSTLTPMLAVVNATDPDSPVLTYDFEIYSGGAVVQSATGIAQDNSGVTSATPGTALTDNTVYQWRSRAYDGQLYGPWTNMASFTIHIPKTSINATINFDPDMLNKSSNGTWVVVYIELPAGYNVRDIDVSSIRLEDTIPAELWPYAIGDHDKDGIPDLMVKFKRSDVINLLPDGDHVTVHVTGKVGTMSYDGVDIIRVMK